jgi:glycosyltransferase involved in cell wall biosynthesis
MARYDKKLQPLADRGPLRVMFLLSSMPVGGAETLLVSLVRRLDRSRFTPLVCCLQTLGPLGEQLAEEIPAFAGLIRGKYDIGVVRRLVKLFKRQRVDAVITVGAGDKMFWGRIAARLARVPVVCSAIHSTGWPDAIERPNRWRLLTRWTDAFIGVAASHGRHLVENERFPASKVCVIPNGVDVDRFEPPEDVEEVRRQLRLPSETPLVGIVAALRPEKNHALFLGAAVQIRRCVPAAQFIVVGDGPERAHLERLAQVLHLDEAVRFVGNRPDVPQWVAALDVFVLTSRIEANPVSILEAMACGKPVVAPRVGSIPDTVTDGRTGFLTAPGDEREVVERVCQLLTDHALAAQLGQAGREDAVRHWSLERMVDGYQRLICEIYEKKAALQAGRGGKSTPQMEPQPVEIA